MRLSLLSIGLFFLVSCSPQPVGIIEYYQDQHQSITQLYNNVRMKLATLDESRLRNPIISKFEFAIDEELKTYAVRINKLQQSIKLTHERNNNPTLANKFNLLKAGSIKAALNKINLSTNDINVFFKLILKELNKEKSIEELDKVKYSIQKTINSLSAYVENNKVRSQKFMNEVFPPVTSKVTPEEQSVPKRNPGRPIPKNLQPKSSNSKEHVSKPSSKEVQEESLNQLKEELNLDQLDL